jgi:hypothetical protein
MAPLALLSVRPFVFGLFFAATVGVASTADLRIRSQVASIAKTDGPQVITLRPGESRMVPVKVAANFPWRLNANSGNPSVTVVPVDLQGSPGGFLAPGNAVAIEVRCESSAATEQTTLLSYTLARR